MRFHETLLSAPARAVSMASRTGGRESWCRRGCSAPDTCPPHARFSPKAGLRARERRFVTSIDPRLPELALSGIRESLLAYRCGGSSGMAVHSHGHAKGWASPDSRFNQRLAPMVTSGGVHHRISRVLKQDHGRVRENL